MFYSFKIIIFGDNLFCRYVFFFKKWKKAYFGLFQSLVLLLSWIIFHFMIFFFVNFRNCFTLILYNLLTFAILVDKFYILDYFYLWFYFEVQGRSVFPCYLSKQVECNIRYITLRPEVSVQFLSMLKTFCQIDQTSPVLS